MTWIGTTLSSPLPLPLPSPSPALLVPKNVCKTSVLQMATLLRHLFLASTPALQLRTVNVAATSLWSFPLLPSPIHCTKTHPD